MSVASDEPDLIGSSRTYEETMIIQTLDPVTDSYVWARVFTDVVTVEYVHNVYFTPNGSKVLSYFRVHQVNYNQRTHAFFYLNADTGD